MDKISTVHCYVSELITNDDGRYDALGSSWFTVPSEWLLRQVAKNGFSSLEDFYSNYTYDNSDGLLQLAVDEGVILGCGTGLMELVKDTTFNLNEYLSNLFKERYPQVTDEQLIQATQGVRYWFDVTVQDSIDDSIETKESF